MEVQALREDGRTVGRFQMLGDYRWYPSDENIGKAKRDLDAVQGQPYLRGFSYGDEVSLSQWAPKDGRDDGLRTMLQAKGFPPEDVLPADEAASVTRGRWTSAGGGSGIVDDEEDARKTPRLYVESRRYIVRRRWIGWRRPRGSCARRSATRSCTGRTSRRTRSSGPSWRCSSRRSGAGRSTEPAQRLLVAGGRAWAADVWLHAGCVPLRPARPTGVIQAYAMPHSPGTTDADFRRTVVTSIAHGAKALDYFQVDARSRRTRRTTFAMTT